MTMIKPASPLPFQLLTFSKTNDAAQIVAALGLDGGLNVSLFDAVDFFYDDDLWVSRKAAFKTGKPEEFAERFVRQMNAYPHLLEALQWIKKNTAAHPNNMVEVASSALKKVGVE